MLPTSVLAHLTSLGPDLVFVTTTEVSLSSLEMAPVTSHHLHPPFAENVTTAPLVSVSLAKLEASDGVASHSFFEACKKLGFFYLSMEGSTLGETLVSEAEQLLQLQQEFFNYCPNEEKELYARGKIDDFFGYRHGELKTKNKDGTFARNETYNVSFLSIFIMCHS